MSSLKSREIHDLIQCFDMGQSTEMVASRMLDILTKVNERMDEIEQTAQTAANTASCLANGIRPD